MLYFQKFIGMIYANSNESSGMQEVLEKIHETYLPYTEDDGGIHQFSKLGVVGDQGSVERGVNALLQMQNGFTPKEQLDGLHLEIADFHGGMKFLQVQ